MARARAECLALTEPTPRPRAARGVAFARLVPGDLARYGGDPVEAERQYEAARAALEHQPLVVPSSTRGS
ncbi:hypothetical protein FHX81_0217 [Saccharothrix saharensis]|uniref:Tetratricopeptide repeat protein n=1 Tax=Saccharothrix saharensis TaxID=571190 RepID=A0A543J575_9PSEU|nr:hypothetical protein [Saccharothrix saharensis]TQM77969.1 hypothetical protein FHX81_0217 [Saccharothrix saharensis]